MSGPSWVGELDPGGLGLSGPQGGRRLHCRPLLPSVLKPQRPGHQPPGHGCICLRSLLRQMQELWKESPVGWGLEFNSPPSNTAALEAVRAHP